MAETEAEYNTQLYKELSFKNRERKPKRGAHTFIKEPVANNKTIAARTAGEPCQHRAIARALALMNVGKGPCHKGPWALPITDELWPVQLL